MNEQLILEQLQKLNENMNQGFLDIKEEMGALEKRVNGRIDAVELRIDTVEQRLNERIDTVEQRLNERIDTVEQGMIARQEQFEEHMLAEFRNVIQTVDAKFAESDEKLAEAIHEVKVYMEVAVGNRVTALFDGYEIEHSHRVTLERNTNWLKRQMEEIQTRLAVLENKHPA